MHTTLPWDPKQTQSFTHTNIYMCVRNTKFRMYSEDGAVPYMDTQRL